VTATSSLALGPDGRGKGAIIGQRRCEELSSEEEEERRTAGSHMLQPEASGLVAVIDKESRILTPASTR
jgi:hypothetical protein